MHTLILFDSGALCQLLDVGIVTADSSETRPISNAASQKLRRN